MKRKTAKEIFVESFRELAEIKTIDRITVREIAANCGYSTATFYRQFKDKYDLIAWDHTRGIADLMNRIDSDGYTWRDALLDCMEYFDEQRDYVVNLLNNTTGHDSFARHMAEINYDALIGHIKKIGGKKEIDKDLRMISRMYCFGFVSVLSDWILGYYEATSKEMAKLFVDALPVPLHKYLINDTL